ncbi:MULTISPECIES: hybrid sensor histidine kinase/response regulator [Pseudomonas]|uniref:hybrid sensor histidine kinase/response regulator n=1 Tax=Pseudomonas TaxID=286 RepID=UPI00257967C0|nr:MULTISPECIES: hybrid sensor histidine kinase/response regulator [Pseudomonas]
MPRICLLLLVFLFAGGVCAMPVAPLDQDELRLSLGPYVGILEDPEGLLDIEQVRRIEDRLFRPAPGVYPNMGKSRSTWWLKVDLRNSRPHALDGFIEVNYPLLDDIQLYLIAPDGTLTRQAGGDTHPFGERPVPVRNFWFPTRVPSGDSVLLVRVQTTSTAFVPLFFATHAASASAQEVAMGFNGAFYGVLFAMFCYNLFLYLSLREPAYFWYLMYNVNIGLFAASFDGLMFQMLPDWLELEALGIYALMYSHCLFALQFSRHFLHTRQHFPRMDRALQLLMLGTVVCLCSEPLIGMMAWTILASLTVLTVSFFSLLAGIYVWNAGLRYGSYYMLAWGVLLLTFIQATTGSLGLEVFGIYGATAVKIGVTVELITLSIGLADRINLLKEEGFLSRQTAEQAVIENKAKSRFLATMSHEIRTPLNGVLGMLQLLKETSLDRSQRFYVETIASSGTALMAVINDILDYARIESGKLALENISFDLEELVSDTLSLFTAQAMEKRLRLHVSLEGGVPQRIKGDPTRLKQVLMNLLGNAIKFTAEGHVALGVTRRTDARGQEQLVFSVSDSGIGMRREVLNTLFQSFAQGDSSTTRRYGGSGLGLAISKELVEMMGGRIEAQSKLGQGTRFTFDIPLQAEPDTDELRDLLEGQHALLASLDATALETVGHLLQRWGIHTEHCRSPEHLLERLESAPSPQLLVLMAPWPGSAEYWLDSLRSFLAPGQRVLLLCPPEQCQRVPASQVLKLFALAQPISVKPLREALLKVYDRTEELPPEAAPAPRQALGDAPCVLVAEDNAVNQLVVQGFLRKRGYRIRLVSNGVAAVEEYRHFPRGVQAILMDCEMPEMDGFEATRRIRQLEREQDLPPVPIIALTAHILEEHRQQGAAVGMDDFLGKPLDSLLLYATLERYLPRPTPAAAPVVDGTDDHSRPAR